MGWFRKGGRVFTWNRKFGELRSWNFCWRHRAHSRTQKSDWLPEKTALQGKHLFVVKQFIYDSMQYQSDSQDSTIVQSNSIKGKIWVDQLAYHKTYNNTSYNNEDYNNISCSLYCNESWISHTMYLSGSHSGVCVPLGVSE